MKVDVLIIGAGPAGLSAAYKTANNGLDTVIVDNQKSIGGYLQQQTETLSNLPLNCNGLKGFEVVDELEEQLHTLGISLLMEASVIGVYQNGDIGIYHKEKVKRLKPARIIIATGAGEKPITFPGWTLPRVFPVGSLQLLLNEGRVLPGKMFILYGSHTYALQLALFINKIPGVSIEIIEKGKTLRSKDAAVLERLKQADIPVHTSTEIISARGKGKVEQVTLLNKETDEEDEREVDVICVDGGRYPTIEVASVFDCELGFDESLGGWLPTYDSSLQTTRDKVYVSGNAAGITNHASIMYTGLIAGVSVSRSLQVIEEDIALAEKRKYWTKIQAVEADVSMDIWQDRVNFMEKMESKALQNHPKEWTFKNNKRDV